MVDEWLPSILIPACIVDQTWGIGKATVRFLPLHDTPQKFIPVGWRVSQYYAFRIASFITVSRIILSSLLWCGQDWLRSVNFCTKNIVLWLWDCKGLKERYNSLSYFPHSAELPCCRLITFLVLGPWCTEAGGAHSYWAMIGWSSATWITVLTLTSMTPLILASFLPPPANFCPSSTTTPSPFSTPSIQTIPSVLAYRWYWSPQNVSLCGFQLLFLLLIPLLFSLFQAKEPCHHYFHTPSSWQAIMSATSFLLSKRQASELSCICSLPNGKRCILP